MHKKELFTETVAVFWNSAFFYNPILIAALGLYPIAAAGYNLKNAVELSLLFVLISLPVSLLFCFAGEMVPLWIRPGLVLVASAVFYLPAAWLTEHIIPGSISALGLFGSLMICNSVIVSRANEYAPTHIGWAAVADALGCSVGFAVLICLCAMIRELWTNGSLWSGNSDSFSGGVSLPFFGFVFIGFLAAFVQWINQRREQRAEKKGVRS